MIYNYMAISYNIRKISLNLMKFSVTFKAELSSMQSLLNKTRIRYSLSYYSRQESSAKLTNQRVSYAFISSPLSFHPVIFCLLPSSSIVIIVFYLFSTVYA